VDGAKAYQVAGSSLDTSLNLTGSHRLTDRSFYQWNFGLPSLNSRNNLSNNILDLFSF